MYIELEQNFKCRLIELFHYILRELLFEQNCKSLNFRATKSVL